MMGARNGFRPRAFVLGVIILVSAACVTPARGSEQPTLSSSLEIGMPMNDLLQSVGPPGRIDPTAFGFEWWVYNQDLTRFLMVAVRDEQVVKIYSNASQWQYREARVGMPLAELLTQMAFRQEIEFPYKTGQFTISPRGGARNWSYLYYDSTAPTETIVTVMYDLHDDNRVTSIMLSEVEAYLATANYRWHLNWRGDRPEFGPQELSPAEQAAVDAASARQALDLINAIRVRNGLHPLYWHSALAKVAQSHTEDMYYNDFFAHVSPTAGIVSDRTRASRIPFSFVGENIAYGWNDAIKTHEALMNSLGHRRNVLNEDFIELGAGAYQSHKYTHKFIRRHRDQLPRPMPDPSGTEDLITVEVERALFALGLREITEDARLITMDTELAKQLRLSPGNRVQLVNMQRSVLQTFTIALLRDEGAPIVRMGAAGRRRLGEEKTFRGYISQNRVSAREMARR
jgi:hypothetical protein